ncbi:MAG TPA: BTAD domain-containing putative transcriptional regulator [Acidimicrobiales bacterium]|nr:BTAD domain-containing putative transcriptional regulator [Acidimicrobiales bacterium]
MHPLPPYHVPRPRLTERCAEQRVVVVEAAAGYGKSVFGAELVHCWRASAIEVVIGHAEMPPLLLASGLCAGARRAGFSEAAATAGEVTSGDPVAVVDSLLDALSRSEDGCVFLIDDAHNASVGAGELIDHISSRLGPRQRLVVLARQLPRGAARLRRAGHCHLELADLALRPEETLEVCGRFGFVVGLQQAQELERATGGWTAVTVLAVARAARTGEGITSLVETLEDGHFAGALAAVLDEAVTALGRAEVPRLAQLARLPLLDADVVGAASGDVTFFERALKAGVPFAPSRGAWWDMPGPVRDYLAALAPLDPEAVRQAAQAYSRRDELGAALQLLLACGDADAAAVLLAKTSPEAAEAMDVSEVRAVFDQLPRQALDAHPHALLVVAYCLRSADHFEAAFSLGERALAIAKQKDDKVLERAASVLLLQKHLLQLDKARAENVARAILSELGPSEQLTRARALHLLGYALGWRLDASGRRDETALQEAAECFTTATNIFGALGMRSMVTRVAILWAMLIDFPSGRSAAALRRLDEALALVADRPRRWAYIMQMRAWVAAEAGLGALCRACVEEMFRFADVHSDENIRAQGHWKLAVLASYQGDANATLANLREAEAHRGTWWGPASGDFLGEAADLLDRVGYVALAHEYLARAKAEPKDAAYIIALSEAAMEARHGDPASAEELLSKAARLRIDPRENWRLTILRAFAAFRRGEDAIAGTLAAQSFEEASRLGQPELPMVRERAIAEQLLGLAAATGQPAAIALKAASLPVLVSVLGRFEVAVAGRPIKLGSGQGVLLLKYLAVCPAPVHAEQAIDMLWPEASSTTGRHRLRTVLNRLRTVAGEVVVRDGDTLSISRAVRVDLHDFLREAERARATARTDLAMAAAIARGAMAGYRGEVLPEDRYADWAEMPRLHAQSVMLELLDLCANEAERRGDLDSLRRTLEKAIDLAPYDDTRYIKGAAALLQQGRRGEALSIVNRARSALAQLGLEPPRSLLELGRSLAG